MSISDQKFKYFLFKINLFLINTSAYVFNFNKKQINSIFKFIKTY